MTSAKERSVFSKACAVYAKACAVFADAEKISAIDKRVITNNKSLAIFHLGHAFSDALNATRDSTRDALTHRTKHKTPRKAYNLRSHPDNPRNNTEL